MMEATPIFNSVARELALDPDLFPARPDVPEPDTHSQARDSRG